MRFRLLEAIGFSMRGAAARAGPTSGLRFITPPRGSATLVRVQVSAYGSLTPRGGAWFAWVEGVASSTPGAVTLRPGMALGLQKRVGWE